LERKRHYLNVMLTDDKALRLRARATEGDEDIGTVAREIVNGR
jgi:hypothetical protein